MVTEKGKSQPELDQADGLKSTDKDKFFAFKLRKPHAIIGGLLLAGASIYGVTEALKSPEDRAREAFEDLFENPPSPDTTIITPSTTAPRPAVSSPNAPPVTGEQPEVTAPPSTAPEKSTEEALLEVLAPTFSQIVNAAPVSPYDVALKVEDFPNPEDDPLKFLRAELYSYSLITTHAYGNESIVYALFDPEKPYEGLDGLINLTSVVGRFRNPPEGDPKYTEDSPNFGSYYRALETDKMDVIVRNGGNTIVIKPFVLEWINFNYSEDRGGWYFTRKEVISDSTVRTYEKQTLVLENGDGELIETQVWRLVTQGS